MRAIRKMRMHAAMLLSHGLVSTENVVPMAQMFNTVGWFSRDMATFPRVTDVLLPPDVNDAAHSCSLFQYLGLYGRLHLRDPQRFGVQGDEVVDNGNLGNFVSSNVPIVGKFMNGLSATEASSSCVSALSEFKANHAEWVNTLMLNLGAGIRERVQEAVASKDESTMDDLHAVRTKFKSALASLLKNIYAM
ncbi:amidase 1-like [Aegilops tauschii subsp. strangulata]|uniref:amidase 1-like n=1 Tax=Aegilops tauschii subsp. strangulata TaxID=200361 RepID=UPI00098A12FB|nr:amidase 1-like [Aegilops tauschii subsp. strangulata]